MIRRVAVLGSTGSIGENAVSVIKQLSGRIEVVGLAAGSRVQRLAEQTRELHCRWAYTADADQLPLLRRLTSSSCGALCDPADLCEAVVADDVDMVLCAIVGTAGLAPVLAAIRAGKDIALASKEILVMAGRLVMEEAEKYGVRILPVDSEHCAIHQCLRDSPRTDIRRLIITASGGPFRDRPDLDLGTVTPAQALQHPTWNMGSKITIDSATLMNKGLEVIEARWLFDVSPNRIETVVHPQSIVHSMVEFTDASVIAQLGYPDMRLPIQYCLTYPERLPSRLQPLDIAQRLALDFEPPQHKRFPAITLAKQALAAGGTHTAAFNAANEVAVEAFCQHRLSFPGIWQVVEHVLNDHPRRQRPDLPMILADDRQARHLATDVIARIGRPPMPA